MQCRSACTLFSCLLLNPAIFEKSKLEGPAGPNHLKCIHKSGIFMVPSANSGMTACSSDPNILWSLEACLFSVGAVLLNCVQQLAEGQKRGYID